MSKLTSRRTVLHLLTGLSVSLLLPACQNSTIPEDSSPLQVGTNVGNVPWQLENESGELVGFEIDLVNIIAQRLDREVEYQDITFINLFPAVLSHRIDLAVSSITITKSRLETVDFTQPYYDSDQSLMVQSDSEITGLTDMQGKVVAVESGSTADEWVQGHQGQYNFKEVRRYEGLQPAIEDLRAGVYDGYVGDIPAFLYYAENNPGVKVVERIPTEEQYSMMFAKGDPLRDRINDIITTLKQEGILAEIHEKWFGSPPEEGTSTVEVLPIPQLEEN
ncbi:ABC transporter substrate-binding protein [Spirulina sp. CS-785/01]|uniref:ABC transporter substrate-binding protein n=1 Tax=Spirulina sp. CS-785/01 TaxID=3021716 RepID=UPI00232D2A22|nr:ABC transporter substrate-binding protein [Spirulina sp. CS-785/01]MDB9312659.1 ABC transporter substrate-binding protein [Spirulina sp. CS-785/01]